MHRNHPNVMVFACALIAMAVLPFTTIGRQLGGIGTLAIVLICPLSHLLLMRLMPGEHCQPSRQPVEAGQAHEGEVVCRLQKWGYSGSFGMYT